MAKKITLPPSAQQAEIINFFSDKLGQKLKNTKIVDNGDGTENVELELENKIITIIMDQSGSMTWNDPNNFRHDIVTDLINKIDINYPGDITYNLIEYGADIVNVLFFGVIEKDGFNPNDINSLSKMIKADDEANYDGMRVVRNETHYPTSILDGDIVYDGFSSRIREDGLTEGQIYYYTVYTYDKDYRFSQGIRIKVTPRDRVVPRATSSFKTVVESDDLTKGVPFIGYGANRDDSAIAIWHMDEKEGKYVYDFSDSKKILTHTRETPTWLYEDNVPVGKSGLIFNGSTDCLEADDSDEVLYINLTAANKESFTIGAWVYAYEDGGTQKTIISRSQSLLVVNYLLTIDANKNLRFETDSYSQSSSFEVESNKWQFVGAIYDASQDSLILFNNNVIETYSSVGMDAAATVSPNVFVGSFENVGTLQFLGKMAEVSIYKETKDSTWINSQLINNPIYDGEGEEVDTEIIGRKADNGDRLVVFKYDVPDDYNFVGGEVIVVKNEKHIPSWEEDGTVIYQQADLGAGQFFVSDADDFALGETYYYKLFTKNSVNNVSFLSDSPSIEIEIPKSDTTDDFLSLENEISSPMAPLIGQLITAGNKKTYLRWKQQSPLDSRISRVKIYYSSFDFPVVDKNGGSNGQLVFTGLSTDEKFVHREIPNGVNAFYTIVNVDKYGWASNYNPDGDQVENFLHATIIPNIDASENTFPLVEVENINHELIDEDSITIGWKTPKKSVEDIDAFFDQTVYIYASISDEFGGAISEDTPIKMRIAASISRESQADDVFNSKGTTFFEDIDAYDFFVTRSKDGTFIKAILRMSTDGSIISQIKDATFQVQLKALLPKEGGYTSPNEDNGEPGNAVEEYIEVLKSLIDNDETDTPETSDNFFEYYSDIITISFTNPWEVELISRDNQKVTQRCYCEKTDKVSGEKRLTATSEYFNGVYIKASAPFVARAKVKYKGEPVESGNIQLAVWDADSSEPCRNACVEGNNSPPPYEGPALIPSVTVFPPSSTMSLIQGTEETYSGSGEYVDISYVDIPLYATDVPQAVRLFVKGEKSGYSSIKDLYILFKSILKIDIQADAPRVDGKDIGEQRSNVFIINPDYPNYETNEYDKSLITYPDDLTIVEWGFSFVQTLDDAEYSGDKNLYSTDSVPLTNGVYSYTRNGVARNVFLGPIPRGDKKIDEKWEVNATISYKGLIDKARQFISFSYDPAQFDKISARFLMEIDGGWRGTLPNQTYGGGGWMTSDVNQLWADGINYKKIKISRDPRVALSSDFFAASCFRDCASQDDNELLELSSGQIVEIIAGEGFEILHGEINELEDPYTGVHYLEAVEDTGFIDNESAFIELNDEEDTDITYFYIRVNSFVPNAKRVYDSECDFPKVRLINECTCLAPPNGITECDLPEWSEMRYISGKTTVLLNNRPLVLTGGGDMATGIPPCPVALNEPLSCVIEWVKVVNYYQDSTGGNIYSITTDIDPNKYSHFGGVDDGTPNLVTPTSDINIRIKFYWRGDDIPDGTPIYVSVGDNNNRTLFIPSRNVYSTETHEDEGYTYVDVTLNPRGPVEETTTEEVFIYSNYDENNKTDREIGKRFYITLDKKEDEIIIPPDPTDPSVEDIPQLEDLTPYSGTVDRYSINDNSWSVVSSMSEPRGNAFVGIVGDKIYYMGGLKNNNLNVSNKTEQYDILGDRWSYAKNMIKPRFAGMAETIGNDIYIIGGISPDITRQNELVVEISVNVYHTDTDEWESLSSLPTVNEGGAFEDPLGVAFGTSQHVVIDGKNYIYVMSGVKKVIASESQFVISEYNQRVLRYCVEDDNWEYSDILRSNELVNYKRIAPQSLFYDDKIIVFDGAIESGNDFIYSPEDFYINVFKNFETPSGGEWINLGSSYMNDFPVPKFQSSMVKYDIDPSSDESDYYILGGWNDYAPSLDLIEKISAQGVTFLYDSSYLSLEPSVILASLPKAKHGASAIFSSADGEPYIYLMGGYTINRDDDFVDVTFDI